MELINIRGTVVAVSYGCATGETETDRNGAFIDLTYDDGRIVRIAARGYGTETHLSLWESRHGETVSCVMVSNTNDGAAHLPYAMK